MTRARSAAQNIKTELLGLVKGIDVMPHKHVCTSRHLPLLLKQLKKLDTVRYFFNLSETLAGCGCCVGYEGVCALRDDGRWPDDHIDDFDYLEHPEDAYPCPAYDCPLLTDLRAKKVILTSFHSGEYFEHMKGVIRHAETVTIVLSPDTKSFKHGSALSINIRMTGLAQKTPGAKLRLIIAPWSSKVARVGFGPNADPDSWRYRRAIKPAEIVAFLSTAISKDFETTVFLIEGVYRDARIDGIPTHLRALPAPPLHDIEAGVRAGFGASIDDDPKVIFKSRADYLQEGVTDEIDEKELRRWRRVEAVDQEDRERKACRLECLEEQKKWKRDMEEEGGHLMAYGVPEEWLLGSDSERHAMIAQDQASVDQLEEEDSAMICWILDKIEELEAMSVAT